MLASLLAAVVTGGVLAWANLRWTVRSRPPSTYYGGTWLWDNEVSDTGFYDPETGSTFICRERGWPFGFRSVVMAAKLYDGATIRMRPEWIGRARLFTKPGELGAIFVDSVLAVALIVFAALAVRHPTRWALRKWGGPTCDRSEERPEAST
ncbi:MAG: hypothetical protein ACYTKD_17180 [Planctomycetota bacterium]|jgi:hypothetical protein